MLIDAVAAAAAFLLNLQFQPGETLRHHADIVERTDWVLPKARLEAFRRGGAVITEDLRTTLDSRETVEHFDGEFARLFGIAHITTFDVPRQITTTKNQTVRDEVTVHNHQVYDSAMLEVAEAALADLPSTPVTVGSQWTTTEHVTTELGSGKLTLVHRVASVVDTLVQVAVTGRGIITGKEYNLPKLLPGSIEVHGSGWFDPRLGFFTREDYDIHNTLLKPAGAERIGYDETQSVDIVTVLDR
jgi:hypothetical protein